MTEEDKIKEAIKKGYVLENMIPKDNDIPFDDVVHLKYSDGSTLELFDVGKVYAEEFYKQYLLLKSF